MDLTTIIIIAIALAMDSFSISITKGFTIKNINTVQSLWIGIFFGFFQGFMPILGWVSGVQLEYFLSKVAPWIAFVLLVAIGIKMIYESIKNDEEKNSKKGQFSFKELTFMGIATSIDAFAIGVTLAFLNTPIIIPAIIIGLVSFIFSEIGIAIGKIMGRFFKDKFEILGGVVLIILGFKILLEGLRII
ncbi:MAG: manganese efflux pump MntP family protein [Methanobrevibacter sp.]|nr:manganese efflux pump MntP family protein [Methanobrevibacter sp.]